MGVEAGGNILTVELELEAAVISRLNLNKHEPNGSMQGWKATNCKNKGGGPL